MPIERAYVSRYTRKQQLVKIGLLLGLILGGVMAIIFLQ